MQTGPPGALLPLPIRVVLRDLQGLPLTGVAISFQAAPGTVLENADRVTNTAGEALAWMRLPASEGVALATATAAKQVATFSARAANTILPSFPSINQDFSQPIGNSTVPIRDHGALLVSAANILRFYQDRGLLPTPNGLADPLSLNLFLKDYCAVTSPDNARACDGFLPLADGQYPLVNLARVPAFAGASAVFEFGTPRLETIRDWLAEGDPVLLALHMTANSIPVGTHYIVARGIAANGGILTFDPSTFFGRSSLNDFLIDFSAGGRVWRGSLVSTVRLRRGPPGPNYFYMLASAQFETVAERGACPAAQKWLDLPAVLSSNREAQPVWFAICDAPATEYQVNVDASGNFHLEASSGDLAAGVASVRGQGQSAYGITFEPQWKLAPQSVHLDQALPPLNAANLQPQLAPGSLMSVFGSGLIAPGGHVYIEVAGYPLAPVSKSPFRLTTWLPPGLAPGRHPARIEHALGQVEFEVELLEAAPAVFQDEMGQALITNLDGSTVSGSNPAARGADILVYATGLGELSGMQARAAVSAEIEGNPSTVKSVDWVPDQAGVYQVRVTVPATQAPGTALSLVLKQMSASSIPVRVAIH